MEAKSQVELLHQISNIVSSNLTLEKMLQELIGLAVEVTDCDACLVYLLDRNRKEIVLRASQLPHTKEIGHIRMKMGEGITGWVAQNKSVVALGANASADSRFKSFQKLPEDTYPGVPVGAAGHRRRTDRRHQHSPPVQASSHARTKSRWSPSWANRWAARLPRAELAERSERATRRMEALAGLAEGINEKNYLDRILQTIAEMVADKLDSPVCSVMLVDEERQELNISAARCSSEDYLHRMPLKIEESLIGRVVRERQPIMIPNVLEEKQYRYPELARKTGLASLLSVPMFTRDTVIGTINIYTREVAPVRRRRNRFRQGGGRPGRDRHRKRAADVGNAGGQARAGNPQGRGARQGHHAAQVPHHGRGCLLEAAQ